MNVTFEREYGVGSVQAVPVNVYDYYKPGQSQCLIRKKTKSKDPLSQFMVEFDEFRFNV